MDGTNPRRRLSILDRGGADPADARRVHLVGIGGSGMRSLADVLAAAGWTLSGSDANREALDGLPFAVRAGHASEAIDARLELVVYSDAVPRGNAELLRARELGIETLSYPQMLGRLFAERSGVAVAGTHGKSTTTAMAGEILATAGLDPTVICGAAPLGRATGGRLGGGRWLVAEACEYRANFRFLKPRLGVILGIEADHFDCFGSKRELEAAFAEFAQALPADGVLLVRADCPATRSATADVACACESFGLSAAATWRATELRERRGLYWLRIRCRDRLVCDVKLRVPGVHNVYNALAAAALASHSGANGSAIRQGLERFRGLSRRLELVAEGDPLAIVDDYAHHPTAVSASLAAVRQMFPGRRVWCVFQPHQASRTRNLLHEFAHSLQNADKIIVTGIFRARETEGLSGETTAEQLAQRAAAGGREVHYLPSTGEVGHYLQRALAAGDVLVTLGAGDIGKVAHDLGQGIRTLRQAG